MNQFRTKLETPDRKINTMHQGFGTQFFASLNIHHHF